MSGRVRRLTPHPLIVSRPVFRNLSTGLGLAGPLLALAVVRLFFVSSLNLRQWTNRCDAPPPYPPLGPSAGQMKSAVNRIAMLAIKIPALSIPWGIRGKVRTDTAGGGLKVGSHR
ncbi:hypothetical protein Mal65_37680 [Crateriforma conspicua]|nr:hypothetical protein Mal65_37680 [Crateriforma conspicua]